MTKGNWITLSLVVFATIILSGCKKTQHDKECLSYTKAPVIKIEGLNTGLVNQDISLTVYFGCFSGCGQFGKFEQTSNGNTTTINVIAKYQGCICTQDAPIRQTIYNFKGSQPGTYYLKFFQTENAYLTYMLTVQ